MVKHLPTMRETQVRSLDREDPLEKEMAAHSSTLAWKIPWTEESDRLQSMGSQRVRHYWVTSLSLYMSPQRWFFFSYLCLCQMILQRSAFRGSPGGQVVKNRPCNARDTRWIPGPRSHMQQGYQVHEPQLLILWALEPVLCDERSHYSEKPTHCN